MYNEYVKFSPANFSRNYFYYFEEFILMSVKNIYVLLSNLLMLGLLLISPNSSVSGAPARKERVFARQAIVGVWQINHAASDKMLNQIRFDFRKLPPPVLFAPESLVLAADETGSEITINEIFEKIIHTQTLPLGEKMSGEDTPLDEPIAVKAFWRERKLVVEITAAQVGKVIKTFEPANKNQLVVTTRVENKRFAKPLTVRRVYDRMTDESATATSAADVNIADFFYGGQIYIDGFTDGRLPPKSSIREVRINSNPLSAEYDRIGFRRIELFTKPGTDNFRGQRFFNFNDESLNSRNPFADSSAPYQSRQFGGNVSGPLSKKSSFF